MTLGQEDIMSLEPKLGPVGVIVIILKAVIIIASQVIVAIIIVIGLLSGIIAVIVIDHGLLGKLFAGRLLPKAGRMVPHQVFNALEQK